MEEQYDTTKIFETDNKAQKRAIQLLKKAIPLFSYFMDGSRKVYKIGDIITPENKFMPVVAGQVSVGCCFRNKTGDIHRYSIEKKNYLMLSSAINAEDYEYIKAGYEKDMSGVLPIVVGKYKFDKANTDRPVDSAIACIQKYMQDAEIEMLKKMVTSNKLDTENLLVIDGSLQFLSQKFNPDIFYNVLGVSKSFNPNATNMTKGKMHIGTLLSKLEFAERTPVLLSKTDKYSYGVWYLRIRNTYSKGDPLDGIIKIEKMALKDDIDNEGFDTCIVDNISRALIDERNPTCYGNDGRWANHIYPIYLTEKMIKSSFMSDIHFINLF